MSIMHPTTGSSGHGHASFLEPIFRPFAALAERVRYYNKLAEAEADLHALSDHELSDIGITRDNIHARVWEDYKSY